MKTDSSKKKSSKKKKLHKKHFKGVQKKKGKKSEFNLLQKNSDGTSNWDKLAKTLGYQMKSIKVPAFQQENHVSPAKGNSSTTFTKDGKKNFNVNNKQIKDRPVRRNAFAGIRDIGNCLPSTRNQTGDSSNHKNNVGANPESATTSQPRRRYSKYVAMDCEMVGTGTTGNDSMIARVSLVDRFNDCIYDAYVQPKDAITDYRTSVSGIRPSDLNSAKDLYAVQEDVLNLLEGKILVGHALKNDLDVLFISHPKAMIRDTSRYKPFRQLFDGKTPSLKKLTVKLLGQEIQTGEHNSIEDAQAAMQLYLTHKGEWEKELKLKRRRKRTQSRGSVEQQSVI